MKEQVVTPRAGRSPSSGGSRGGNSGIVQRPARRERNASTQARQNSGLLRRSLRYVPLFTKISLAVIAGVLIFTGYRAAASASFFQVRSVDVSGTGRASADEIRNTARRAAQATGVWGADLDAVSKELERLPWVRRAVVSRVLPDGLRVRVTEREPRAVVRTSQGRFVWVDEDAVTLDAFQPTDQMPYFFIRGWDEDATASARTGNRERMAKYLEMLGEWQSLGLVERVSEVNLIDLNDVRVQLVGEDAHIEVRVGKENFGQRLRAALKQLDEERNTARGPFITRIDASMWMKKGDKVVLGINANAPSLIKTGSAPDDAETVKDRTSAGNETSDRAIDSSKKRTDETARSRRDAAKRDDDKKEQKKKKERDEDSAKQSRPRRVG